MAFSTEIRESRIFAAEIKLFVPPEQVSPLRDWARARLSPDPFGSGPHGDTYLTNSLYFDTLEFDVFHRRGSYGRSKFRVRRYGDAPQLFLERKLKTRDLVSKRRSIIEQHELTRLSDLDPRQGWAGHWFHRRLLKRRLRLVCQVEYARTALVGVNPHGPVRLTLDENVRATVTAQLGFHRLANAPRLTGGRAILELKYYRAMPPIFEEAIERFSLVPQSISKYRMAVAALDLAAVEAHEVVI